MWMKEIFNKTTGKITAGGAGVKATFFGFEGFGDLFNSLIGAKFAIVTFPIAFLGGVHSFIGKYLWDDPMAIYTMWGIIAADMISGVYKSIKAKTFKPDKMLKSLAYLFFYTIAVGISNNFAKYSPAAYAMPGVVYFGICSVTSISFFLNLSEAGILSKELGELIKKQLSIERFFKPGKKE